MADQFGSDPHMADQMARELAQVRSNMTSMGRTFDGFDGVTASTSIEGALHDFFSESSDYRENMDGLLKRASGLLTGLAEGTTSVDQTLAGSLEPEDGSQSRDAAPVGGNPR